MTALGSLATSASLALAVLFVYVQSWNFKFVNFDDDVYIYANPTVKQGLTIENLRSLLVRPHADLWHPLTTLTHLTDVEMYGLWAGGHHLTSVALHVLATLLIYRAFQLLTGSTNRSALLAAVFALHPLRVESVVWVCERKDVLSGVMLGWLLIAYARYIRRPSRTTYICSLVIFILGCMAKPTFVTVPFVLLLLDYWPLYSDRRTKPEAVERYWKRRVVEKVPYLTVSLIVSWVTIVFQRPAIQSFEAIGVQSRIMNSAISYVVYLRQFFLPTKLTVFYPHRFNDIPLWEAAIAAVLLIGITIICFAARRSCPYFIVGWLWYLGMLVPVIGLLQAGIQAHADRFTYLPQIGIALAVVWGLADLTVAWKWSVKWKLAATGAVVIAMIWTSWRQAGTWTDGLSLFTRNVALTERNAVGQNNLAVALDLAGRPDAALEHARKASEIDVHYVGALANYGDLLRRVGKFDEAVSVLSRAAVLDPENLDILVNQGESLLQLGRTAEAAVIFEGVLLRNDSHGGARINLGLTRYRQERFSDAIAEYRRALEIVPDSAACYSNLGLALLQSNNRPEALIAFRRSLEIRPDHLDTLLSAASMVAATRAFDLATSTEAVGWANRAVELTGRVEPIPLDILASTLAGARRYSEAVVVAEVGLKAAKEKGQSVVVATIEAHLHRFRNGAPITE